MSSTYPPAPAASVAELVEQRAQLQAWLARVDELATEVPPHVSERVRSDYEERLDAVVRSLAEHAEELHRQREHLLADLGEAEQRHEESLDALEEARLRFRVGEVPETEWEERRPALEEAADAAAGVARELRAELESHQEILDLVGEPAEEETDLHRIYLPELRVATDEVEEDVVPEEEAALPEDFDEGMDVDPEATLPEPGAELAFLRVLDRAIAEETAEAPVRVLSDAEPEKRPKPGVKCPDCGYTNDSSAWYCGVCGVDLT